MDLCLNNNYCKGCYGEFTSYEDYLLKKEKRVLDLFTNAKITEFEYLGIESSPEKFGYRNKMEYTFGDFDKGGPLTLGLHPKGRRFSIVSVPNCRIVDEDFRKILETSELYFRGKNLPHYKIMNHQGYLRNLVVRKGKNTSEILVNIVTTSSEKFDFTEYKDMLLSLDLSAQIKSILHSTNDSLADAVMADTTEILYGRDHIFETLLGLKFKIYPLSFFQTNSYGAEKLYSIVKDFLGNTEDKTIFDLYCGTGTIGQIVAPCAKKVCGIELNEDAVKSASENAELNGLNNCEFIAGDVAKVIKTITLKPDAIIVDPPRPGIHPEAMKHLLTFEASEIVYVSCNPESLVNDLKPLLEGGYSIEKVKIMDMFPWTKHVETCILLYKVK